MSIWNRYNVEYKKGNKIKLVATHVTIRQALVAYLKARQKGLPVYITNLSIKSVLSTQDVSRALSTLVLQHN